MAMAPGLFSQIFLFVFCVVLVVAEATLSVNLPFGDINVLVLTDVHSWVGGHGKKEPGLDADYGHVLSFYQRLRAFCQTTNRDLWFVANGDWIDGTGLAMNGDPSYLVPLELKMPWDAVNIGNHELYDNEVIDYMTRPGGFLEWWGPRMLSSNIRHTVSQEPLGNNFRLLRGSNSSVLVFGFLYNMGDHADHVTVKTVESVTEEGWFKQVLKDLKYDAIMVLAHMHCRDDLVSIILSRIRAAVGNEMPVQFITGHTHKRVFSELDNASVSFEAGRFLDTIGFASFPKKATLQSAPARNLTSLSLFHHTFINANTDVLKDILGVDILDTEDGEELSKLIARTQKELGLEEVVGCLSESYFVNRSLEELDSLWKFFRDNVIPPQFGEMDILFMEKGSWRYDLIGGGNIRIDDLIGVAPYNETFVAWESVPSEVIDILNRSMNAENYLDELAMLPEFLLLPARPPFQPSGAVYNFVTSHFLASKIQEQFTNAYANASGGDWIPWKNKTTTGIWIDYFRAQRGCVGKSHSSGPNSGTSPFGLDLGIAVSEDQVDRLRLGFAVVAVIVVISLATVSIKQRGAVFQRISDERERATLDALRDEEEDADSDEEEGQFV